MTDLNQLPPGEKKSRISGKLGVVMMLTGIFVSSFFIFWLSELTVISSWEVFMILLGGAFAGAVLQYPYFIRMEEFSLFRYIIYNLTGIGPHVCALVLALNFFFARSPGREETYEAVGVTMNENSLSFGYGDLLVVLKGDKYSDHLYFLSFNPPPDTNVKAIRGVKLVFREGLFGYEVLKEKELLF